MSERRQVWQTLSDLLTRLEKAVSASQAARGPAERDISALNQEVHKLGKAQFKANLLAEQQASRWERAIAGVEETQAQHAQLLEAISAERVAAARHELLEAIMPALDGLENAIASGQSYLDKRDKASAFPGLSPAQKALVSPMDRKMLAAWLDGLRLVRDRLLAVLEVGEVTPILTVGHPFDPYLHVAVGTTSEGNGTSGIIVAEERRGYRSSAGVLRYAEVIVYRQEEER
ncbi:MAG TPA: nucleotide exchange factor GrpE [Anaerolineae bacterium]|nr:nucleotide exchange factor GrpE [Anaerolineae bacterium]